MMSEMVAIREKFNSTYFELEQTKRKLHRANEEADFHRQESAKLKQAIETTQKKHEQEKSELSKKYETVLKENKQQTAQIAQLRSGIVQFNKDDAKEENNESSDSDSNVYVVEKIIGHKIKKKKMHYLIKWKNFDETWNSWESEDNLQCPVFLKAYKKAHKLK